MAEYELDALLVTGVRNTMCLRDSTEPFADELWYEMTHGLDPHLLAIVPDSPEKSFAFGPHSFNLKGLPVERVTCEMLPETTLQASVEELRSRGLGNARIGVDMAHTPAASLSALQGGLPEAEFLDAETVLMQMRSVKTADEIACLQKAVEIAEQAFEDIRGVFHDGVPWSEVIRALASAVLNRGGAPHVLHPFEMISPGWRKWSAATDGLVRSTTHIERGATTRIDLCICHKGYYSDFKLPVCLGEPSAHAVCVVQEHVERLEFMYEIVRPGKTKREINDAVQKEYRNIEEYDWWLHGVGFDYHEEPRIGSRYPSSPEIRPEIIFEEGNVLALEPSWVVEELTVLEKEGPRTLNRLPTREITVL